MLDRVSLRSLRALVAVAEEGTFLGAADALRLSQGAISQQISKLEDEIGQPVFDRPGGPRPVTLTAVGKVMLARARRILDQLDIAAQEVNDVVNGTGGRLVCGSFQSVSVQFLPQIVERLLAESPNIDINIEEETFNRELADRLLAGELDLTFLTDPITDERVENIPLGTDPFIVMLPLGSPLTPANKRGSVQLTELTSVSLVGQHEDMCQALIDESMRTRGVNPRYKFKTNDNGTVQAMVRAGMGPAIMPVLTIDPDDPDITVWSIEPPIEPRTIYIAALKGPARSAAAARFIEIAKEVGRARLDRIPTSGRGR